ncbi:MAG: DUF4214 domain-containing protein [Actinomycetota bacterium]
MRDRAVVLVVFGFAIFLADFSLLPANALTPDADSLTEFPFDQTAGGTPLPSGLVEIEAPIIVETGGHLTTNEPFDPDNADHEVSNEVQDAMEEHAREIRAYANARAGIGSGLPPAHFAASNGGISVTYDATYVAPSSVQTVVNAAVAEWDAVLATNPAGPIVVEVFWSDLGNPSLLGYAGPDGMYYGGSLPTSSLHPAALTNTLLGMDANGAGRPEVQVVLNSELMDNNRWYLGTTGTPPGYQIDLFSVVLHEIGHGLGFLGSATIPSGQSTPSLNSTPYVYDDAARHGGVPVAEVTDQSAALVSGDVFIQISEGIQYELYAPSSWAQGSSYSHFDEATYQPGQPGALMTPMLNSGEVARTIDAAILGLMARTGWPITVAATSPTITNVSASLTAAIVSWDHNLADVGVAPDSYTVEAWRDGTVLQSTAVATGGSSTVTVGSLTPGQNYTIRVVPNGPNGAGTAATAGVQLLNSGGPADPADWPTYIRDLPLDGQINRLYQAYFLRLPDESGWQYWLDQRAALTPLADVSSAFAGSTEFQELYGSLTNEAFVDLVYANVLNRLADVEGRAYWVGQLDAGVDRGAVMIGFAESAEYVDRTGTAPATGSNEAKIDRLYQAFFGRAPDEAGLSYWAGQAADGVALETIAAAFATSAEFQAQYGLLSNEGFVSLVYSNVLDRTADTEGLSYWTGQLDGGIDRGTVMVGFSESAEFIKSTGTLP